ncbi:MAG TPA: cytochrome c biogenesis protein CcsA [Symbiobacteriaceae bacterium]|jgi:ABC-type transport system involved in cytochrome c biogenesis permease subunit|nr:cytochrome c biogenesis protein CcsA [Symbiobacteriaceae bacterium]
MGVLLTLLLAGSAALYTLAAVAHLFYMFRREFDFLAKWSTRLAWLLHTVTLVLLVVHSGRAPVYSLFEFATLFTWTLMSFYIALEYTRDNQAAGSFLLPVVASLQVIGVALPKPSPEHMVAAYPASLIGWHIGVTMLGYGFFFASFVAGALYLLQERNLRRKNFSPLYYRLPSLEVLDIWGGRFVYIGFPLLTFGMAAGLGFAHVQWATFWQADPKVIFTVFVWTVYGAYMLMRKVVGWGGRKAAWWSVAGVAVLLINYFVMNMFSRLHRFG